MRKNINTKILRQSVILSVIFCSILIFSTAAVQASQLTVHANRFVVLDDPNDGTAQVSAGFFNPSSARGSWGTAYWGGESTTIRSTALVVNDGGSPISGVTVTFKLYNPGGGAPVNTTSSASNTEGLAYYSFNLDNKNYWGYWKIDANTTIGGTNVVNSTSFILNWWGCAQCHGSNDPGKWGTMYTPKSYYTMGFDFHKSQSVSKHTELMSKGNCITCHQTYNGTPINRRYSGDTPTINVESEYTPDWHNGKTKCQDCHQGSNISTTPQGKNPEIAGCYDTAGCHTKKNTNLTGVNSTTGYVVGGSYRTNYSDIQNSNAAKAHNASGTGVTCIACHDAGHNISKPYNAVSTSNSYTENDQCWSCHTNRTTTHYSSSNCVSCHTQNAHRVTKGVGGENCVTCHPTYVSAVGNTTHNQSKNAGAPACKDCHINYNSTSGLGHNGYIVNEANTCRNAGCHNTKDESHGTLQTSGADCTQCHFANTTKKFDKNQSLYAHDHNLTVEHNFYEYNQSGIPLESNGGVGKGMFPYYSCTLTCHNGNVGGQPKIEKEVISWNESAHARSLRYPAANDNKNNCAKCKSPPNYNDSLKVANPNVSAADWQGIQCRVCHNLHNDSYSGTTSPAFPLAFYNATASSLTGSPIYDKVSGSTQLCEKCHTGTTHDSKFAGTHKNTGMGCADCHVNSTFNDESHKFEVKNTTTGVIGCEVCHNPVDHTFQFTVNHAGKVTCEACHDKTVSRNATGFAVSSDNNYGIYKDPLTGEWSSYKMSHGVPATWPLHNITRNISCDKCHGTYSPYNGTIRQNTLIVQTGGADCKSCHDVGSSNAPVHVNFSVAGGTDSLHTNLNSGAQSTVDTSNKKCWACHGDGTQPVGGHPPNYKTPKTCENCHVQLQGGYNSPAVNNHYWNGTNITTASVSSCKQCHNKTEMMLSVSGAEVTDNSNHYGKKRPDLVAQVGTNSYCTYCHNTTTENIIFGVGDYNNSIVNHSTSGATPLCTTCHNTGRLHDSGLTKPTSSDTLCKSCHTTKSEHKTLYCTECHANASNGNIAGKDIHGIKFLQKDNTFSQDRTNSVDCTTCHQKSVVDSSIGTTPLKISDPLHHSDDINNGSKWDNYWTSPITACLYCHNDTRHDATPLGRPLIWNTSYIMGTTVGTGTNCADCHQKGDSNYNAMKLTFEAKALPIPPEITNGSWKGKPGYYNHTLGDYTDSQCKSCHDKGGSTTVDQLIHNVSVGTSGGPDCKSCHDIGGIAPAHVNFSVAGGTDSLHTNLNSGAQSTVDASNKKCWACHGDGTQPANGQHPSNYRTPYTCENCHVQLQGGYNSPAVNNHYWNGTNITTGSVSSCKQCHNKTEMMLSVSGAEVTDNPNHYGKKRSDLTALSGTNSYCTYCHNSTVNGATFYVSDYNNSIVNHSISGTTPLCTTCHSTGRLHDSGLAKPTSSDTLCKSCHTTKSEHKTLYCTECHANASNGNIAGKDIHGIKFLQKDNTFSQDRTNSVDCTTCHQKSVVDSSLGGIVVPKVNDPLHHSDNISNGSIWGSYWTPTNPITACLYCHNDTKHSATPLGRPLEWNSSYEMNTVIGSGTNCADCHYQGDINYGGMSSAFTNGGLAIPPEITSGGWNGKPGYFNHTLSDYTDTKCRTCHGDAGISTVGALIHNVSKGGAGGDDCIGCHNSVSPAAPQVVDIAVFNTSIHQNINDPVNKDYRVTNEDCWQCHFNKDMIRTNIKKCRDCHAKPQQWHGNANIDTNLTNLSIK